MIRPTHVSARAEQYQRAGGPWDQPSLDALLTGAADASSSKLLIVDGDNRVDGRDLNARVAQLASEFLALGVVCGDVVTWQYPNSIDAIVALRACWRIGAIAAPLHHNFAAREVASLHNRIQPKLILNNERPLSTAPASNAHAEVANLWSGGTALAAVLFTSGSSGTPKGVLHTQHTLAYKARSMAAVHGLTSDDVVLMPAPLAHISGLLNGVTLPGSLPFTSVLMARWNPEAALDLIESERVSFMVGPPTFFVSLMRSPKFSTERVHSLRLISSGGSDVSPEFVQLASDTFHAVVKRTYGSTEAPTVATSAPTDRVEFAGRHDGRAIGEVELRTIASGELLVRGPEVCVGYLDDNQTSEAFDAEGWYATGDLATIDNGWLTITGRIADIIIRGGENISTNEVERALTAHPSIAAAVVVGYRDDYMGERVGACVVASAPVSLADLQAWFEACGVAKYKTPERLVALESIPLLPSGKPDRTALRAQVEEANQAG